MVTPAGEWLLDNYHLVASEIRQVRHDLPRGYYHELPKLASRGEAGHARVYALAVEILRHSDSLLDRQQLARFLDSFQTVAPLTIGELWAWPSMLKLALIENLRRLADELMAARAAQRAADAYVARIDAAGKGDAPPLPSALHPAYVVRLLLRVREYGPRLSAVRVGLDHHLAASPTTSEEVIRGEHQREAAAQVSVANVITSLRLCAQLDWSQYFEAVSLVERVLLRDPAGAHGRMDFLSRDRYRQAVEELAEQSGEAQVRVALRAVESARQAAEAEGPSARAAHVGYHLIGPGRRGLEADIAFRPGLAKGLRRFAFAHATAAYLGTIALFTAALAAAGVWYVQHRQGSLAEQIVAALLLALPASQVAIAFAQRLATRFVPPRRLPRLDLAAGLPDGARTLVVVPTLLTSVRGVEALIEHVEVLALGNLDPRIHFAILGDYADAAARDLPEDAAILAAARSGVEALNARLGEGRADRFALLHRDRQWNAAEGAWMGWERKRGKLEELNRLLRGATDTSFEVVAGDLASLQGVRYCITLDTDTRLPRDAARKLVGIIAHPLNRPHFDPRAGRITEGYAILQPRVSVTTSSAAGSRFAAIFAGHTGVDPYTTAVSDTYQDLFGEGTFTGKGLYDVDAFTAALDGRVPDNALLSHDLFEGVHARTALVTDVEVVDDYPSSVLAHARRQHRWTRGDWQILAWLFPFVPTRAGLRRNRLPLIARWKILDNLRRSLLAPATVALLLAAWTVLPGNPLLWTAAVLAAMAFPLFPLALDVLAGPRPQQPWRAFARGAVEDVRTTLARIALQVTFLAYEAWAMVHAITVTLVRLAITQRRLLEWETAAASAARLEGLGGRGPRQFLTTMVASPAVALAGLVLVVATGRPGALLAAVPVLRPLGRRAARGPPAEPAHRAPPPRAGGGRPPAPARPRPPDVALLRGLRGRGGPRAAAGQLPGAARAAARAPHLAHQHRHGARLHPGGARPRLHPDARAGRADRRHAHHDGGAGAAGGAPLQLVRHGEPRAAAAALRLHRGQRQPRRGAPGRAEGLREQGLAELARAGRRLRRRDELPLPLRSEAPALLHRLPQRGRGGSRPARPRPLRPARLGGAARQLHRHRQGRPAGGALVPPGPDRHQRARRRPRSSPGAARSSSTSCRCSSRSSYPGTLLDDACRMAVRRQQDYAEQRARAVGHLGVRLRRSWTATTATSTRPSACPAWASSAGWPASWWWRPTRRRSPPWWTPPRRRRTCDAWRPRGSTVRTGPTTPSTTRAGATRTPSRPRWARPRRGARSWPSTSPTTRG